MTFEELAATQGPPANDVSENKAGMAAANRLPEQKDSDALIEPAAPIE